MYNMNAIQANKNVVIVFMIFVHQYIQIYALFSDGEISSPLKLNSMLLQLMTEAFGLFSISTYNIITILN